jgi:dienelactone hydrolase
MRTLALAVLLVLAAACSGTPATSTIPATTMTTEASTTTTEPVPLVVTSDRIAAPDGVRASNVRYRSETVAGESTEMTGWIAIPDAPAGMPIMVWAHPTVGLDDACAPTVFGGLTPFHVEPMLDAGWVVIAPDYEGLGGPGTHPYLVSESEARSIFDLARAAREIEGDIGTEMVLWGFSQGGHAVLAAGGLADELGPEFDLGGIAAVAPAVDLIGWTTAGIGTLEQGYLVAMVAGFEAAYGLDVTDVLTPRAVALLEEVVTSCADPTFHSVARLPGPEVFHTDPATIEPWADLLVLNSPEFHAIEAPVLLVLGSEDDLWDLELTDVILERMCAVGSPVATSIYVGADHGSVNTAAAGEILAFLTDRLAGEPFVGDC